MNITKEIIFDMDGTIADLYGVEDWLPKLRSEDVSPYRDAKPMYNEIALNGILQELKRMGYSIVVVSWGAKDASRKYDIAVERAKKEWLYRHSFPADEIHVVPYGTPKARFIKSQFSILIDDNSDIRNDFLKSTFGLFRWVIDANENIISQLFKLLVA